MTQSGHKVYWLAHHREEVLEEAQARGADLVVMGAYSHSRLRELFLGGVTQHVLENATLPVLMMR